MAAVWFGLVCLVLTGPAAVLGRRRLRYERVLDLLHSSLADAFRSLTVAFQEVIPAVQRFGTAMHALVEAFAVEYPAAGHLVRGAHGEGALHLEQRTVFGQPVKPYYTGPVDPS